jgi:hypothetical protein
MRLPHRHDQEPDIGSLARDIADDAGGLAERQIKFEALAEKRAFELVADSIYAMWELTPAKKVGTARRKSGRNLTLIHSRQMTEHGPELTVTSNAGATVGRFCLLAGRYHLGQVTATISRRGFLHFNKVEAMADRLPASSVENSRFMRCDIFYGPTP